MKKVLFILALAFLFLSIPDCVLAQQKVISLATTRVVDFKKILGVDSVKSEQVSAIELNYQTGLHGVIVDTTITEEQRLASIKLLVLERNKKMKDILTTAQMSKLVPLGHLTPLTSKKPN